MATNQKLLLAVMSCRTFRDNRVASQRATWLKDKHPDVDVRFFYGNVCKNLKDLQDDEVILNVPDDYQNFPLKVKAMFTWAREHCYTNVLKIDDDCHGVLDRVAKAVPREGVHYCGRVRGPSGNKPAPYASGFAYWLDTVAMDVIINAKWDYDVAEDRWVSNELFKHGIKPEADYRYVVVNSKRNAISGKEGCRKNNGVVISCEYEIPEMMQSAHDQWINAPSSRPGHSIPDGSLSQVTILIKTFMRDGYLFQCLAGLEPYFQSAKFLIVDDGWHERAKATRYADLRFWGHSVVVMPFDSGFGAKSNVVLEYLDRDYVLIGSDDFAFVPEVRKAVENMVTVMNKRPDLGWVGGHVNNTPYEGDFTIVDGVITETPLAKLNKTPLDASGVQYFECDLTVNWGLCRREVFDQVHWCPEWKIGGDHFMFFDALKTAGWKSAVIPSANINTFPNVPQWKLGDYDKMRGRAWDALPGFFKYRGIKQYTLFDGSRDVLEGDVLRHYTRDGRITHEVKVTPENSTVKCDVCGFEKTL